MIPPTTMGDLSGSSTSCWSGRCTRAASAAWTRRRGWSEMYRPSMSFSICSSSSFENSSTSSDGGGGAAPASKSPVCPEARSRCARFDQALEHALVHRAGIHALQEVEQRGIRAAFFAGAEDRLDRAEPDVLH